MENNDNNTDIPVAKPIISQNNDETNSTVVRGIPIVKSSTSTYSKEYEEEQKKRIKKVQKYFKKGFAFIGCFAMISIPLAIIGIVIALYGGPAAVVLCIPLIVLVLWLILRDKKAVTENYIDSLKAEGLAEVSDRSKNKTYVDESELISEPLLLTTHRKWDRAGAFSGEKKGADNIYRYTPIDITQLYMTDNRLISYQACLDLTTGKFLNEGTAEFYYEDIVSIETLTESASIEFVGQAKKKFEKLQIAGKIGNLMQINHTEWFVITTTAGTKLKIGIRDEGLLSKMGADNNARTDSEKSVQAIRAMIRDKKKS